MNLTRKMHHIWIGPHQPPLHWMDTWRQKHPQWDYSIFTDDMLKARTWHNQHLIDNYYQMGVWAGVADLIRYELLYEQGGFLRPADSTYLKNMEELYTNQTDCAYTGCENNRNHTIELN